jgi:DNA-binding transcriptional LysR family regulator
MDNQINFEWLKTFKYIYQYGTITEASNHLGVTQPAVTNQLKLLEKKLNKKLFERTIKKMIPTDFAKMLYVQLVEPIEKLENIDIISNEKFNKPINIGSPQEFFVKKVAPNLKSITSKVNFIFSTTDVLIDMLTKGDLDIVIASKKITYPNLIYKEFFEEEFFVVGNKNIETKVFQKNIEENNIDEIEKDLHSFKWISYSNDLPIIKRFWKNNFNKRPNIQTSLVIPNLNAILEVIKQNQEYLSILPSYLYKDISGIKEIWKGYKSSSNKLYLTFQKNNIDKYEIREILNLLSNIK